MHPTAKKNPISGDDAALICGSLAYDTIMGFPDRFRTHILPEKIHILNVCFLVPELRREFGGCAGNIAYNLQLLGSRGLPMATVGQDFAPYTEWLGKCGIAQDHVRTIDGTHTAQAFITTDLDNNQVTAFHPGAMQHSHVNTVADAKDARIGIGIVAPDGRQGMLEHAQQFAAAGIPFIFDPGQGLPMFEGHELDDFIEQASWVAVNDYEFEMLQQKTGRTADQLAARVEALIVTRGGDGSVIRAGGRQYAIPCARPRAIVDPTGCGDAYRAGLLHGLLRGLDWESIGRIASLMGAIKIESRGTQNHRFTLGDFEQRYAENFGASMEPAFAA